MPDDSLALNSREIAVALWLSVLFVFGFAKSASARKALYSLIKSAFNRKICLPLIAVFMPLLWSLMVFAHYQVLEAYMLKTTILWLLTAGIAMSFKATEIKSKDSFLRIILLRLFKLTLVLEFVINLYVFPLLVELVLVPVTALVTTLPIVARASKRKDYEPVRKLLEGVMAFIGIFLFVFTLVNILNHPDTFFTLANFKLMMLPLVLTLLHMPAVYIMALYFAYERIFTILGVLYPAFRASRRIKLACIRKCNFHIKSIRKMQPFLVKEITPSLREDEILQLVRQFSS